jgi:phosphohistidine swiveling domain-containing protein
MLDDEPGSAYRIASSLGADGPKAQKMIAEMAIRLCDGTAKMNGNESDMVIVHDDPKAYKKAVAYLFAGRIRVKAKWYQPVAYVSDVGPRDVGCDPRAKHYCGRDEIVLEQAGFPDPKFPDIKREVIFVQCGERPHWHDVPLTPQAALEEYLKVGRRLEKRGHSVQYKGEDVVEKPTSRYKEPTADDEALWAVQETARLARVAELRKQILAQAGDDLIELSWPAEENNVPFRGGDEPERTPAGSAMIPRAPFINWAFAKINFLKIDLPPWKTVSPSGMKMGGDDPMHTDWVIGGGFDPRDRRLYFSGVYNRACERLRTKIQDEADARKQAEEEKVTTLVVGPVATGPVHFGKLNKASPKGSVVILPNLNPKYLAAVVDAVAVITEEGGELAHLAQVGLERGLPIVRREGALEMFGKGDTVTVDSEGRTAKPVRHYFTSPEDVDDA